MIGRADISAVWARARSAVRGGFTRFARARRGNVAMITALSMIPMLGAAGAGIDLTRGIIVQHNLTSTLDAAALAIGARPGLTQAEAQTLAQQYFNANFRLSNAFGTPTGLTATVSGQQVQLNVMDRMPTTIMNIMGIRHVDLHASSTVVWGQTKLWVSLVLDNTGSMSQTDSSGTSKMTALKTATNQLLNTLEGAAANAGDVQVAIIPFSKDVNVGASNVSQSWIDWTDWESEPPNGTNVSGSWSSYGPGSSCPYSNNSHGFRCQTTPTNGGSTTNTIPSSGAYAGYICPTVDNGSRNNGRDGRYYNGCYNSVGTPTTNHSYSNGTSQNTICSKNSKPSGNCTTQNYCAGYPPGGQVTQTSNTSGNTTTTTTTTTTCSCSGNGNNASCRLDSSWTSDAATTTTGAPYTHTWIPNARSTWSGCVMDRTQSYDTNAATPTGGATNFPAENATSCVSSLIGNLSYNWSSLHNAVNAMTANGNTNQTIGLAWGMQAQTGGAPMSPGSLPSNTSQFIILVSDGLNTQNRWSTSQSSIDARMAQACSTAKAQGFIIYTIFVDLGGTQGNSSVLQNCASDSSKYFDLTTSGALVTTLNQIGQQITNLRVSQ